jgi:hypothetical protein
MKRRVVVIILVSLVVVSSLVGIAVYRLLVPSPSLQVRAFSRPSSNPIIPENAHQGTNAWQIPGDKTASTEIQAYTSATSVLPGQQLTFYVSTQQDNTPYSIEIFRIGWYGGTGGRLMAERNDLLGRAQGYYKTVTHRLVDCTSCRVDVSTGLVEANWQPSYTLTVPSSWTTGIYLAKFTDVNDMQSYAPFDVKSTAPALYIAATPDTTYQAYNNWGGYSLYIAYTKVGTGVLGRGVKVSFDRPYSEPNGYGSGQVLTIEAASIRWLERQGYNVSYISDVDLHNDPAQLLHYSAYLSLGHDEYWTKEMRDGVQQARDKGVGLAFLGANAVYWQMRFQANSANIPNRTIVCYKVQTENKDLKHDPFYNKDNSRVTTQWRDPLLAEPENALVGIMFSADSHKIRGFPWQVNPLINSPLLAKTGLQGGHSYGCGLVGYEWDHVFDNGATPSGLQVLSISQTRSDFGIADYSNTTYYIAQSGAMVFATGAIYWTLALDSYRLYSDTQCPSESRVVPGMQQLMANVMANLVVLHSAL